MKAVKSIIVLSSLLMLALIVSSCGYTSSKSITYDNGSLLTGISEVETVTEESKNEESTTETDISSQTKESKESTGLQENTTESEKASAKETEKIVNEHSTESGTKIFYDNETSVRLYNEFSKMYSVGELEYVEKASGEKHYFSSDEAKIIVRYLCINALYCEAHFNVDYDYVIHLEGNVVYYNATYGTLGNSEFTTLCGEDKDNFNNILESYDYQ